MGLIFAFWSINTIGKDLQVFEKKAALPYHHLVGCDKDTCHRQRKRQKCCTVVDALSGKAIPEKEDCN